MISKRLVLVGCAAMAAVTLWPTTAMAQRGPRPRGGVVVSAGYYRPYYYRPYYAGFYSPFYAPFYNPYWYGFYAQYPPPYYYGRSSWASARIEVKPRQAQVFVDGYYVGVVDQFDGVFQRLDLPTGEHELVVYLPGHRSYREKNLYRPGEGYHIRAVLEPLPAGAADEPAPKPSPDSPEARRDPQDRGPRDPYRPPQEQNPPYPGDRPYPRDPGDPRDPRIPGRAAPMPNDRRAPQNRDFGTLNIRVQPGDAVVVIDGERWDSPEGGSRLVIDLAGGQHRIEVRKDGFKPYTTTIQIRPGESQALNVSLPPGGNE